MSTNLERVLGCNRCQLTGAHPCRIVMTLPGCGEIWRASPEHAGAEARSPEHRQSPSGEQQPISKACCGPHPSSRHPSSTRLLEPVTLPRVTCPVTQNLCLADPEPHPGASSGPGLNSMQEEESIRLPGACRGAAPAFHQTHVVSDASKQEGDLGTGPQCNTPQLPTAAHPFVPDTLVGVSDHTVPA